MRVPKPKYGWPPSNGVDTSGFAVGSRVRHYRVDAGLGTIVSLSSSHSGDERIWFVEWDDKSKWPGAYPQAEYTLRLA